MTKDDVTKLGIAAQNAHDIFAILSMENTQTDPVKRVEQIARYETARTEKHAAEAIHRMALTQIES